MSASQTIIRYLDRVRRRTVTLSLARFVAQMVALIALAWLGLALVAAGISGSRWPPGILILLIISIGFVYVLFSVRMFRRTAGVRAMARWVGRRRPDLYSDLLSVAELPRASAAHSGALVDELTRRTAKRLGRQPPHQLVSAETVRPSVLLLAAAGLAWAVALAVVPARVSAGTVALISPERAPALLTEGPLVTDLSLRLGFPAYLGRAERQVNGATGHLLAPLGTRVGLSARPARRLASATVILNIDGKPAPSRLPMTSRPDGSLSAGWILNGAGTYRFEVTTPGGRRLLGAVQRRLVVEPDAVPLVTLIGPPDGSEVRAGNMVELGYRVSDDHALRRLDLVHRVDDGEPVSVPLWTAGGSAARETLRGRTDWDLSQLDLYPGARLTCWLAARDNDTVSGPKVGMSTTLTLKLADTAAPHEVNEALFQAALDRGVQVLGDRLLLFLDDPPLPEAMRHERARDAHRHLSRWIDVLGELNGRVMDDPHLARSVRRSLTLLRRRLDGVQRRERPLFKGATRSPAVRGVLARLARNNPTVIGQVERGVLLLADLLDQSRLEDLEALKRRIERDYQTLARLVADHKRSPSESKKKKILQLVKRIRRQVERFAERASKLRDLVPDEYLNADALKRVDLNGALDRLARAMQRGDVGSLDKEMRRLQGELDQLDALLSQNIGRFRQARLGKQDRAVSRLLDRLRGLERQQRALADRTGRWADRSEGAGKGGSRLVMKRKAHNILKQLEKEQKELALRVANAAKLPGEDEHKARGAAPFWGVEESSTTQEAARLMRRATGKLRRARAGGAVKDQRAAADRLARVRRRVQRSRSSEAGRRSGRVRLKERIRIPGAADDQDSRLFRRRLLRAMKEDAPRAYRERIRRYYEELIR